MILRFSFSLVFIFSLFGMQQVVAMELRAGCVPPLACDLVVHQAACKENHECIPSGKCVGTCFSETDKTRLLEKMQEQQKRQATLERLKKAVEELVKIDGKQRATKIAEQLIEESSDSDDTQSQANSPASREDEL